MFSIVLIFYCYNVLYCSLVFSYSIVLLFSSLVFLYCFLFFYCSIVLHCSPLLCYCAILLFNSIALLYCPILLHYCVLFYRGLFLVCYSVVPYCVLLNDNKRLNDTLLYLHCSFFFQIIYKMLMILVPSMICYITLSSFNNWSFFVLCQKVLFNHIGIVPKYIIK